MITKDELLHRMECRAQAFLDHPDVRAKMLPFANAARDPLGCWCLETKTHDLAKVKKTVFKHDWGPKDDKWPTLQQNIDYVEACWKGTVQKDSLSNLFWGPARASIENGTAFVLNAVCGQREPKLYPTGMEPLPHEIHEAAVDYWLWVITQLKIGSVYLAGGNWAWTLK
jgi:hypothetical protein